MKTKLLLLFLLLLIFGGFIGSKFFILDKENTFGKLKIISSPATEVFIDNVPVSSTPYENKYKVGEYLIKLIPDKGATDTASWQGKINIYKNALTYVNRELGNSDITSAGEIFTITKMDKKPKNDTVGEIYVETEPTGAIVYLDNDEKGVAPLILADVLKGDHELSVFMPGFFRRTQKVNVTSGYRVNAQFKLALDASSAPKVASPSPKLSITPDVKGEATKSATTKKTTILIKDTPTGFLRVRSEPSISAEEVIQVKPGETYEFLEESDGWYKIRFDTNKSGWVYSQYATKVEPTP